LFLSLSLSAVGHVLPNSPSTVTAFLSLYHLIISNRTSSSDKTTVIYKYLPSLTFSLLNPFIPFTYRFELLDPALLRSGRFDRIVQCPLPDREGRNAILLVHTKKLKLAAEVDLDRWVTVF
jgi:SpoVK/Ycf46/Vps4 family AAA+-type ATPase